MNYARFILIMALMVTGYNYCQRAELKQKSQELGDARRASLAKKLSLLDWALYSPVVKKTKYTSNPLMMAGADETGVAPDTLGPDVYSTWLANKSNAR